MEPREELKNHKIIEHIIKLQKAQVFIVTLKSKIREKWLEDVLNWSVKFSEFSAWSMAALSPPPV